MKAITGVVLSTFPNVSLIIKICLCLLTISLISVKAGLYATKNAIMFLCIALVLFRRVDLSKLSYFLFGFELCFPCTLSPWFA